MKISNLSIGFSSSATLTDINTYEITGDMSAILTDEEDGSKHTIDVGKIKVIYNHDGLFADTKKSDGALAADVAIIEAMLPEVPSITLVGSVTYPDASLKSTIEAAYQHGLTDPCRTCIKAVSDTAKEIAQQDNKGE